MNKQPEKDVLQKQKWKNPFLVHENQDLSCGLFGWKPKWLQSCNNMKVFMLCFVCLGVFRGMSHSYLGAVLPSIEKRFGFSSEMVGTVKAMSDVSQLMTALLIAHFGGAGHRPRWISLGTFIVGIGFLLQASPEILFPQAGKLPSSLSQTKGSAANEQFCHAVSEFDHARNLSRAQEKVTDCATELTTDEHAGPLIVLGVAEFLMGLGGTTSLILGLPFIDDQVKSKNTPLYNALSFSGMFFGPLLGLGLGAVVNNIYVDFSATTLKPTDPRWISAWYLGFIVCGIGTCIFALTLGCFPSAVPESTKTTKRIMVNEDTKTMEEVVELEQPIAKKQKPVTIKDLPYNLKRLFMTQIYMIELLSQLVNSFIIAGFMSFMQKFMKEQYQVPQSVANLAGGMPPVFASIVGIFVGSVIQKRFRLPPRKVCWLMAGSSLCGAVCYFGVIGLGCDRHPVMGLDNTDNPYNTSLSGFCKGESDCRCGQLQFNPVCDLSTDTSFVSACEAGCKATKTLNGSRAGGQTKFYLGCSCMGNSSSSSNISNISPVVSNNTSAGSSVVSGLCSKSCPNFVGYIVLMCIAKFFMGLPMAGVIMVQFRVVDYDLKSLANGVSSFVMSAFGFLPAPILCGMLIDSACILWEKNSCGIKGACWIYNVDDFRWKLHAAVGSARLITAFLDLIVSYKVRNMTFDREADLKTGPKGHPSMANMIENIDEQELNKMDLTGTENKSKIGLSNGYTEDNPVNVVFTQ